MADETKKTETTETKKTSKLGAIIATIIGILIGAGAMFGVEEYILQKTSGDIFFKNYNNIVLNEAADDVFADEGIVAIAITDSKKAEIKEKLIAKFNAADTIAKNVKAALAATKADIEAELKAEEAKVEAKVEGEKAPEATAPAADAAATVEAAATDVKKD